MKLFVRRVVSSDYTRDSKKYSVALLEMQKMNGDFFSFALYLTSVSEWVHRVIYLEGREEAVFIDRYFSLEGGVTKQLPRPQSDWWKNTTDWLVKAVCGDTETWVKVEKPKQDARPRSFRPRVLEKWRRERRDRFYKAA